jgi:hypothetical protein
VKHFTFTELVVADLERSAAFSTQAEHGVRAGFLADPDGHLLEICQLLAS